jgi:hypothetical protein
MDDREQLSEMLKELGSFEATSDAYLVRGMVICEWISPSGKKFLTHNTIGEMAVWDEQGFLFNALHGGPEWIDSEDEDIQDLDEE